MTQIQVAYEGTHRCYATDMGRDRLYVGCEHKTPREAIRHADLLASRSADETKPYSAAGTVAHRPSEPSDARRLTLPTAYPLSQAVGSASNTSPGPLAARPFGGQGNGTLGL